MHCAPRSGGCGCACVNCTEYHFCIVSLHDPKLYPSLPACIAQPDSRSVIIYGGACTPISQLENETHADFIPSFPYSVQAGKTWTLTGELGARAPHASLTGGATDDNQEAGLNPTTHKETALGIPAEEMEPHPLPWMKVCCLRTA